MASYAAIAVEGVLAGSTKDRKLGQPIQSGVRLYNALRKSYKIVLLTLQDDPDVVSRWLTLADIREYGSVMGPVRVAEFIDTRRDQLAELRVLNYDVELFVDASPRFVAHGLHLGVTSLLFGSPEYARPEFRPDARQEIREWGTIEAELATQQRLRGKQPETADLA